MEHKPTRGLAIRFMDGSSLNISFPSQTEDRYKRKLLVEDFIKNRLLMVHADGAVHFIPFENIKYMSVFPAPEHIDNTVIQGASISE